MPTVKQKQNRPVSIIIYAPSGCGKTSLAAQFPRCGFIVDSQERGIEHLSFRGLVPDPVWIDVVDVTKWSTWEKMLIRIINASGDSKIDTIVLESLTGIENICFLHHAKHRFSTGQYPDGDLTKEGFYNRWQGPKGAARFDWPLLIQALQQCLDCGKNVVVTAHAQQKETTTPEGSTYMTYYPYVEKDTWERIHRWASAVFFLGQRTRENVNASTMKRVAHADFDRIIYTNPTPYCAAKNWYGIERVLPGGVSPKESYENIAKFLQPKGM